ncbi:hypothetical protein M1146_05275 [Patescibacteria group bacterium]|nr:hypothetical protein [Patescibacteria group bacterium]
MSIIVNPFVDVNDTTLQQGPQFTPTHFPSLTDYPIPQFLHCSHPRLTCQATFKDHVDLSQWSAQCFNIKIEEQDKDMEIDGRIRLIHIDEIILENVRAPQCHDFDTRCYVFLPVSIDTLTASNLLGKTVLTVTIDLVANGAGTSVEIQFPLPSQVYEVIGDGE